MTKRNRHLGATPNDNDPDKAYPASVSSLFASLRQYWPSHTGEKPADYHMKGPEFTAEPPQSFCDAFDYVANNFRRLDRNDKSGNRNHRGAAYAFRRIENGGKNAKLGYEQIILAAQWVGLTVAQFMTFCHFASTERRAENEKADSRQVLLARIDEYQRFLDEMKEIIQTSDNMHVFYEIKPEDEHKFFVKESLLLRLAKAVGRK